MAGKAVISLSTGMEDPEKVTVASWSRSARRSGAADADVQAKEAVRQADGVAAGVRAMAEPLRTC